MRRLLVICVALLTVTGYAMAQQSSTLTVAEAKALCTQGDKLLQNKQYSDALAAARQVLAQLPESPRARAVYTKAVVALSTENSETREMWESIISTYGIAISLLKEQALLLTEIRRLDSNATDAITDGTNRMANLADQIEAAQETDTESITETKQGNTTFRTTRKFRGDKQRTIARKSLELKTAADTTSALIAKNRGQVAPLRARLADSKLELADAQVEIVYLSSRAAAKAATRDGYALALSFAVAGDCIPHTGLTEAVDRLTAMCRGDKPSIESRGILLALLDAQTTPRPTGGRFVVDLMQDKISLYAISALGSSVDRFLNYSQEPNYLN